MIGNDSRLEHGGFDNEWCKAIKATKHNPKQLGHECPLAPIGTKLEYVVNLREPKYRDEADKANTFFRIVGSSTGREKSKHPGEGELKWRGKVVDIRFSHDCQGSCWAFGDLALVFMNNGHVVNPGNALNIDCERCPVLKAIGEEMIQTSTWKWWQKCRKWWEIWKRIKVEK